MKNSVTKLTDKVLDAYPVTRDYLKKVIAVEALHNSTTLAITRLLEIIESQQAQLDIGSRTRKFRKCWIDVLERLAVKTVFRYVDKMSLEIPRKDFLRDVNANDFSLMKHWGLISQRSNHKWSITRKGIGFLLQLPGYRFVNDSIIQAGGIKDNYHSNPKSKPVELSDFGITYLYEGDKEILKTIFDNMDA